MTDEPTGANDRDTGVFAEPAPAFSTGALRAALAGHWGMTDPRLRPLGSERDLNVLVDDTHVLKISNPAEHAAVVDMEVRALDHVRAGDPGLPVPEGVPATGGGQIAHLRDDRGRDCLARLITLLPGAPLEGAGPLSGGLAEQIGAVTARTALALRGFFHTAADRPLLWDIRRTPEVLEASGGGTDRLRELAERVRPALRTVPGLPSGVQHADITLTNVLADAGLVTGVIDFGDAHHTAAAVDLAGTLASVLRGAPDLSRVWLLTEALLRGYQRHRPLIPAEADVLGELVIARLVTSLAVSAARRDRHSDNHTYITQYDASSAQALELLAALTPGELADRIGRLAGTRDLSAAVPPAERPARRAAVMGGPLSPLFYRRPLDIVRGEGPWLFAADGTRYLDAYNNVPVVGHAHPAVTAAVGRQMAELNTHSRYLHAAVVDLAERVVATMPSGLDTCLFTTSGTEANELAWRLATEYTGAEGAVIAEHAYHGASRWMADLSSNEWPEGHRPGRVATFEAPHGPLDALTAQVAAGRIADAAAALAAAGERPAMVLADSQFTSEGILDTPDTFFAGLVEGSRAAGALYLADEVQAGYGRSGPQLWRFARAGVTPDLVTLGKPMGAGYPIGAVVTRREIADVLARKYEYFSTFAATPAAAAAGHAVLDILELTGLPARAVEAGEALRHRIAGVADGEPLLGDVRGTGLLAGVDVRAQGGRTSRETALDLLEALVSRQVLAGLTGPRGDVLKVRPPLVWEQTHVDRFADALRQALDDVRS